MFRRRQPINSRSSYRRVSCFPFERVAQSDQILSGSAGLFTL